MAKTATKSKKSKKEAAVDKEQQRQQQRQAVLSLVDTMHREKNISKDIIFGGIESAIQLAIERASLEEVDVLVHIDRASGEIIAQRGDQMMEPEHLGRIAAQAARQVMTQKIREAESEGVYSEFQARKGDLITATVQRVDNGTAIVTVTKDAKSSGTVEAILPRSEQIPGETHQVNDRIKAVVMDVRKQGHRVKIVLSRCHPDFVRGAVRAGNPRDPGPDDRNQAGGPRGRISLEGRGLEHRHEGRLRRRLRWRAWQPDQERHRRDQR